MGIILFGLRVVVSYNYNDNNNGPQTPLALYIYTLNIGLYIYYNTNAGIIFVYNYILYYRGIGNRLLRDNYDEGYWIPDAI